jgi:hypothetical protein
MNFVSKLTLASGIILGSCCTKDFIIPEQVPDYDFYEGAIDITNIMNACSENAIYSTEGATRDKVGGSCWEKSTTDYNRWFKFTAPPSEYVSFYVHIGGEYGTQTATVTALWDADGVTEIACGSIFDNIGTSYFGTSNVTAGQVYYISVDTEGIPGTFSVCIDDTD